MIMMMNSKSIATMKNLFTRLMLVAVAAMGFVACQEGYEDVTITPEAKEIVMTFVAEAPDTRTSVTIDENVAKYSWSVDEDGNLTDRVLFLQTQDANDKVNSKYSDSEESSISEGVATFVTKFTEVTGASVFNYAAIFPAQNFSGDALTSIGVKLPATQTLTENNYDPNADLMMSKLIEGVAAKDGHGGNLQFSRLAAIGRMNLKGIAAGETINKVVITFENEVVNGDVTIDFEGATASYAENGSNTITLQNGSLTALAGGTPIFFTCFPGEYSGAYSVEVTTDKATYSTDSDKSIAEDKALAFTAGNVTRFNLTVGNCVASESQTYTKLTNTNLVDYSGTYLLVYEDGNVAFDGSLEKLDATQNTIPVEIIDSTITGAYSDYTFTIAKVENGYSIQSASGNYIGRSATSNGLNAAGTYTDAYINTIEKLVIKGSGGATLQYNAASDQKRFRYFASAGQKSIALYRQNGTGSDEEIQLVKLGTPENLKAVVDGNVVNLNWTEVENATNYDVIVVDGDTTNVTTNSASLTLSYKTSYTIKVVAKGGVGFTDSDAAVVPVTTGEKPEETTAWTLVTDASTLAVGDKIIIAAAKYDFALSTTQNSNNRGQAEITKDGDTVDFGSDVQILTVEAGTETGTFAFNTGSGYLYAASSSKNYLRTEETLSANSSWNITIDTDGVAIILAQGTNTNNSLRYNSTSSLFSCYASTTSQPTVAIYRFGSGDNTGGDDNTGDNTGGDDTANTVTFTFANYTKEGTTATEGDVTFTGSKGTATTSTRFWTDGLRTYEGSAMKFEVPSGMVITNIDFTGGSVNDWTGSQQVVEFTDLPKTTITSAVVTYN